MPWSVNCFELETLSKYQEGQILLVDKPREWTSFDVVKKLKYALKVKKIGHAGTLDPLATGLLLIGTGKCTKMLQELQGQDKTYTGIIEIGKTTPSYDLETEFDSESDYTHLLDEQLRSAAGALTGDIEQVPPAHSAVKVDGERAYKKARRSETVEIKPRRVHISRFDIVPNLPEVSFEVQCSKGTYIRTLAHDFGKLLGVGAYLKSLRRTAIGSYQIEDAWDLQEFVEKHRQS